MVSYSAPVALNADHRRAAFESGQPALDDWLRNRALRNEASGGSRTSVVCPRDSQEVVGYYSIAASSVSHEEAPGPVRRNAPRPIPVVLLGRLAVDRAHQGVGLGGGLLRSALVRIAGAAAIVGVRAVLVHAIDESATAFYRRYGFLPSTFDESTLFLPMANIVASFQESLR